MSGDVFAIGQQLPQRLALIRGQRTPGRQFGEVQNVVFAMPDGPIFLSASSVRFKTS